jgi:hypothetical protein
MVTAKHIILDPYIRKPKPTLFERYNRLFERSGNLTHVNQVRTRLISNLAKRLMTDERLVDRLPVRRVENPIGQEDPLDCMFCAYVNALELVTPRRIESEFDALQRKRALIDEAKKMNNGLVMYDLGFSQKMLDKYLPGYTIVKAQTPIEVLKALFVHRAVGFVGHFGKSRFFGHALTMYAERNPDTNAARIVRFGNIFPGLESIDFLVTDINSELESFRKFFHENNSYFFFMPKGTKI